ncbi:MAG: hypothetical protein ACT4QD_04190, partial [Acidobacteriota bacterium]
MAHVITKEPEWTALPATTPGRLRELLGRCLVKDPRNRLQAIGEARIALQQMSDAPGEVAEAMAGAGNNAARSNRRSRRREWIWASVAALSLSAAGWMGSRVRPADAPATDHVRFELTTPEPGGPEYPQGSASLSPDGRQ